MAQLPVSPNQDQMNDFELIPACRVVGMMFKSAWTKTKEGDGNFLKCDFKITRGMFAGKTLVARLNLANKNPVAVEMAFKELNTIKAACQNPAAQDSEQLHGIEMILKVGIDMPEAGSKYGPSNSIKFYSVFDGQTVPPDPTDDEIALTKRLATPVPLGAGGMPSSGFTPPNPQVPGSMPSLGGGVPKVDAIAAAQAAAAATVVNNAVTPPVTETAPAAPAAVKMPWEM